MKIAVIGGNGFLGSHLVDLLLNDGSLSISTIRIYDISDNVTVNYNNNNIVVEYIRGNILDVKELERSCKDADVVFHTASIVDVENRSEVPDNLWKVNVQGTLNVISVCEKMNVKILVYTSSEDVVVGYRDYTGEDESSVSYPNKLSDFMFGAYGYTKMIAERAVLNANQNRKGGLKTTSLRATGLFGERDSWHITPVLKAAKNGIPFRIGDSSSVCQQSYAGNVAWAHICAMKYISNANQNLPNGSNNDNEEDKVSGNAFFIADDEKVCNYLEFLQPYIAAKNVTINY